MLAAFTEDDYAVFALQPFEARMSALRAQIRPKLVSYGQALAERLRAEGGVELWPHVAKHMRRKVNPPEDTWLALARSQRGYKRYAHFALGIEKQGLYARLVLKEEAEDKKILAQRLAAHGLAVVAGLADDLSWLDLPGRKTALPGSALTSADIKALREALAHRSQQSLSVGRPLGRLTLPPEQVMDRATAVFMELWPLYLACVPPKAPAFVADLEVAHEKS